MNRGSALLRSGLTLLAIATMMVVAGCGGEDDDGGPAEPTAQELVAQGWIEFADSDFSAARTKFQEALALDPTLAEGHLGLGWSEAFLDNLENAETELAGVADDAPTAENAEFIQAAQAGLAVVRLALDDASGAINAGNDLLEADADWAFEFRSSVDADDVRLAVAEAYMTQGEGSLDEAQTLLDELDPDNGLDPKEPSTWEVGGETYLTYEAALLKALEAVEAEIGETEFI